MDKLDKIWTALEIAEMGNMPVIFEAADVRMLLEQIKHLGVKNAEILDELDKWRNYNPDNRDLVEARQQAMNKNGEYKNSLAAGHVYIVALEAHIKRLRAALEQVESVNGICPWCGYGEWKVKAYNVDGQMVGLVRSCITHAPDCPRQAALS
jgi:hypothetical protein